MIVDSTEIKKILSNILDCKCEDITDDIDLAKLDFDSLKFINFIVELESKYNIEIYDSDLVMEKFHSVTTILETLVKYFSDDSSQIYKCVITDCDGVLWRGISGEGGNDSPYTDDATNSFCALLHKLGEQGVLLAICSKNGRDNIEVMLNKTMLSPNDFALIETDETNKADAILYILDEFKFSVENAVYVDDSDSELEFIQEKLPGLTLVATGNDNDLVNRLSKLFLNFPVAKVIDRNDQFRKQKEREKLHKSSATPEDFNRILETKTSISKASLRDVERLAELSQRTNRFNLTGARYTSDELVSILDNSDYTIYKLCALDKFGDMGLVAFAVLHLNVIENFFMSCRVFGRGFENELIQVIKQNYGSEIIGIYHPTDKNGYCKNLYKDCCIKYELR